MRKRLRMSTISFLNGGLALCIYKSLNMVDKNPNAVALGKMGGSKGGKARAARLTAEERSASARKAALARWARSKKAKAHKAKHE
jgi:hypothetical protein